MSEHTVSLPVATSRASFKSACASPPAVAAADAGAASSFLEQAVVITSKADTASMARRADMEPPRRYRELQRYHSWHYAPGTSGLVIAARTRTHSGFIHLLS